MLRRVLVFVVVTFGLSIGALVTTLVVLPGRGFLRYVSNTYRLNFQLAEDGHWQELGCEPVGDSDWSPLPRGITVFVEEVSMGRTQPGLWHATRTRVWVVKHAVESDGRLVDFSITAPSSESQGPGLELRKAVAEAIELRVIPESPLWNLWPNGADRTPTPMRNVAWLEWTHESRSSGWPGFVCFVVPSSLVGLFVAARTGQRQRAARTDPAKAA